MSAAVAVAPTGGLEPRDGALWGVAFAAVLFAHLAVGLALLQSSPETGPVEATEPIAMIDLPPAPVLPEAVSALDLPPSDTLSVPAAEARPLGGSTVPDIAPEAPEPIEAPLAALEQLPPETAPPPPVPTVQPPETATVEAAPPATATSLPVPEAAPLAPPLETPPESVPLETAVSEPPLEAAPVVPDAAVALPGPVALPPVKPEVPPPPVVRATPPKAQSVKPDARTPDTQTPGTRTTPRKAAEAPAAKRPAGPAADTPKAGGRPQASASAPRAAGGGPVADILSQYQARVRADIEREVRRMPVSRTGVTTIRFSFSRSGTLAGATVARSSGDPALDRVALTAVKRASPFPAAPAELTQPSFTLTVPIRMK
jgi:protein TonB